MDFISDKLKKIRLLYELKQTEIARHLGISRQTYFKYEKGLSSPSFDQIGKLSLFYKISIYYFFLPFDETDHDFYNGGLELYDVLYRFDHLSTIALRACILRRKYTTRRPIREKHNFSENFIECNEYKATLKNLRNKVIYYMDLMLDSIKQTNIEKNYVSEDNEAKFKIMKYGYSFWLSETEHAEYLKKQEEKRDIEEKIKEINKYRKKRYLFT